MSLKLSNIVGFGNFETLVFKPFFPLVGSVGKNGFWYNTKSDKKYRSRHSILGGM